REGDEADRQRLRADRSAELGSASLAVAADRERLGERMNAALPVEHGVLVRVVRRARAYELGHERRLPALRGTGDHVRPVVPADHARVDEDAPRRENRGYPMDVALERVEDRVDGAIARHAPAVDV